MLDTEGSAARLEEIARDGDLFVVALDGESTAFRVHHLFREFLEAELVRCEPELTPEFHARASRWYEAHGDISRALLHAKQSGDLERVEGLLIERLVDVWTSGGSRTLGGWLSWFTEAECRRSAPLSLAQAWFALGDGRPDDVEEWLARAGAIHHDRPLSDGTPSVEYAVAVTRALVSTEPGDRLLAALEDPLRTNATSSSFFALATIIDATTRWMIGRDDPSAILWRGESAWMRTPVERAAALAYLAIMAFERGERAEAGSLRRRALRTIEEHHLFDHPTMLNTVLILTLIDVATGTAALDRARLAKARNLRLNLGHLAPRSQLLAYVLLAEIHLRLDDRDTVRSVLAEAEPLARRESWATALLERLERIQVGLQERTKVTRALAEPGPASLTPAELRLLALLPTHLLFREIGVRTYRSKTTIHSQAASLYRKLGVNSRSEAVDRARELGLIV